MSGAPSTVSEPIAVQPVFCDGLHTVEVDRHGIARLKLYAEQRDAYSGNMERVVAARLIVPAVELRAMMARVLSSLAMASASQDPPGCHSPLN